MIPEQAKPSNVIHYNQIGFIPGHNPVFLSFPGGSDSKESIAVQETLILLLVWEDPLEEGIASHPSILAWRIPMDRGAWQATPWVRKESDMTE